MIGLDTNALIRYITQDDKDQAEIAGDIIEQNCTIYELLTHFLAFIMV